MKRIIFFIALLTLVMVGTAGCSQETTNTDQTENMSQNSQDETEDKMSSSTYDENAYMQESDLDEVKEEDLEETNIFDLADLQGTVLEFTNSGCTISPQINEGDDLAYEAAVGVEDDAGNITVLYSADTQFQIVTANAEQQEIESINNTEKDELKKQSEVCLFGNYQEDNTFLATRVVIVRWNS